MQQYTRRYSVNVVGIDKKRGESHQDLKKEIEKLVNGVDSPTSMMDVDKFHRNGPARGKEQDVIIRFKSHSAKESFYRNRKSLDDELGIKIKPSLSPNSQNLLRQAQDCLKEFTDLSGMSNPPEFVFANIHGEFLVKFKKRK